MPRRISLLVCENFAAELQAVLKDLPHEGVEVHCFPSDCTQSAFDLQCVDRLIATHHDAAVDEMHVLGACCLAGMQRSLFPEDWHVHYFDQCFYMFVNRALVDFLIQQRAYLLSPGWLANWQENLQKLGFDQQTARRFFAETTQKLVLLDTQIDPNSPAYLQEMARHLDLPCEILPVGLDCFRRYVQNILEKGSRSADLRQADYAMALDLAAQMIGLIHENEVIEKTFDIFSMLFAPQRLVFYPLLDFAFGAVRSRPPQMSVSPSQIEERIRWAAEKREFLELEDGFLFRLHQQDETIGVLEVAQIALPQYRHRYLSAALNVARICGIAVANARSLQKMTAMQKMADLGTLAAGIAHEIYSPLQVITGICDTLFERFIGSRDEKFLKQRLELLSHNAWRIAEIIRAFLSYASPQQLELGLHDLNGIVSDALLIAANQLKDWANIQVQTDFALHLPPLPCDRAKISQALLHLLSNACDAVGGRGAIAIRTGYDAKRRSLLLSVSDNGKGIPKELQPRVFAPFFTTKGIGNGAGLGLSVVQGVVSAHDGEVELVSTAGQGTTFTLYLPEKPQPRRYELDEISGKGRFDDPLSE